MNWLTRIYNYFFVNPTIQEQIDFLNSDTMLIQQLKKNYFIIKTKKSSSIL
jgi:hypothetical protein